MSRTIFVVSLLLVSALVVSANADAVIPNSSFETPVVDGGGNPWLAFASISDLSGVEWTPNNGNAMLGHVACAYLNGTVPADGDQVLMIQTNGELSTTISGLEVGTDYTVSWVDAARNNGVGGSPYQVLVDNVVVYGGDNGIAPGLYQYDFVARESSVFTATDTSATLKIAAFYPSANTTTFFDTFSIAAQTVDVPEPSSLMLLGMGLAGLLCAWRKRK